MAFNEFPKQLYRSGWDNLSDTILVENAEQEGDARQQGFKMLSEPDEDAAAPAAKAARKPKAE